MSRSSTEAPVCRRGCSQNAFRRRDSARTSEPGTTRSAAPETCAACRAACDCSSIAWLDLQSQQTAKLDASAKLKKSLATCCICWLRAAIATTVGCYQVQNHAQVEPAEAWSSRRMSGSVCSQTVANSSLRDVFACPCPTCLSITFGSIRWERMGGAGRP